MPQHSPALPYRWVVHSTPLREICIFFLLLDAISIIGYPNMFYKYIFWIMVNVMKGFIFRICWIFFKSFFKSNLFCMRDLLCVNTVWLMSRCLVNINFIFGLIESSSRPIELNLWLTDGHTIRPCRVYHFSDTLNQC